MRVQLCQLKHESATSHKSLELKRNERKPDAGALCVLGLNSHVGDIWKHLYLSLRRYRGIIDFNKIEGKGKAGVVV